MRPSAVSVHGGDARRAREDVSESRHRGYAYGYVSRVGR
jgi:hypothetical protein